MIALSHAVSAALIHFLWQGAMIAFLLWITLALFRNASPRFRYAAGCAALGAMSVAPMITAWFLYRAPAPPAASTAIVPLAQTAAPAAIAPTTPFLAWLDILEPWALPVWFAGVLIFAIRLIWISGHVARLQRTGDTPDARLAERIEGLIRRMKIAAPVRALISPLTDTPSVVGWIRPVILLPAATLLSLSPEQLEAVLAHELAHIRRHDYLVNLLQSLSEMLLFYHPAVWWVSGRVRHERELCCDDIAVTVCGDTICYARALTKLERLRIPSAELAMNSTGGSLGYRIRRLVQAPHDPAPSKLPALVALCLAVLCLALNPHWAGAQEQNGREAVANRDELWTDTVKFGDMQVKVRALGTITSSTTAALKVPDVVAGEVRTGQSVVLQTRSGITMPGTTAAIAAPAGGTVMVAVDIKTPVPEFAGADVDGTIQIKTLNDVFYLGVPVHGQSNGSDTLFKLEADGVHADRVRVQYGTRSVNSIQILGGLQVGDRVILSDMSRYDGYDRVRLQ